MEQKMSTKRILGIAIFAILLVVAAIIVVLVTSFLRLESDAVKLPETALSTETPNTAEPDALNRIEVTRDTIQAVALSRPKIYKRDVMIESFWDGGSAVFSIDVSVFGNYTSLRINPAIGIEKRIIVTSDVLYIWYKGDTMPFIGEVDSGGDGYRSADEWQMLVTYENVLKLEKNDIIEAGYTEFNDEECIYAIYTSKHFHNTIMLYISLELGLVISVEEHDPDGALVFRMTAGECHVGEIAPAEFALPDGMNLLEG